jgi:hypothetical protein
VCSLVRSACNPKLQVPLVHAALKGLLGGKMLQHWQLHAVARLSICSHAADEIRLRHFGMRVQIAFAAAAAVEVKCKTAVLQAVTLLELLRTAALISLRSCCSCCHTPLALSG